MTTFQCPACQTAFSVDYFWDKVGKPVECPGCKGIWETDWDYCSDEGDPYGNAAAWIAEKLRTAGWQIDEGRPIKPPAGTAFSSSIRKPASSLPTTTSDPRNFAEIENKRRRTMTTKEQRLHYDCDDDFHNSLDKCYISDDEGNTVAIVENLDYDLAERIVRAVNCHDDLVSALQRLLALASPHEWAACEPGERKTFQDARAAIAKATAESTSTNPTVNR